LTTSRQQNSVVAVVSTVVPGVVVVVEGFSLVVVVVKSALVVVDVLVDRDTVELLSATQCSQIIYSNATDSNHFCGQHSRDLHYYVLGFINIHKQTILLVEPIITNNLSIKSKIRCGTFASEYKK